MWQSSWDTVSALWEESPDYRMQRNRKGWKCPGPATCLIMRWACLMPSLWKRPTLGHSKDSAARACKSEKALQGVPVWRGILNLVSIAYKGIIFHTKKIHSFKHTVWWILVIVYNHITSITVKTENSFPTLNSSHEPLCTRSSLSFLASGNRCFLSIVLLFWEFI